MTTRLYTSQNAGKSVMRTAVSVLCLDDSRVHLKDYKMTESGFKFNLNNKRLQKKAIITGDGEPLDRIIEF